MAEKLKSTEDLNARRRSHLTPELRRDFDAAGPAVVEFDVMHERYGYPPGKHDAALAWLADKRREKERLETWRFWLIFWVAAVGTIATLYGMVSGA